MSKSPDAAATSNSANGASVDREPSKALQVPRQVLLQPDPIAEGVHTSSSHGAAVVSSNNNSASGAGGGGKNGKQSFLDGHFAGRWQSNADLPDRRKIILSIIEVIERTTPDANQMFQNRLRLMAKNLEEHLYRSAHTQDDYIDSATLKRRLHIIAKGVSLPTTEDGDDPNPAVPLVSAFGTTESASEDNDDLESRDPFFHFSNQDRRMSYLIHNEEHTDGDILAPHSTTSYGTTEDTDFIRSSPIFATGGSAVGNE